MPSDEKDHLNKFSPNESGSGAPRGGGMPPAGGMNPNLNSGVQMVIFYLIMTILFALCLNYFGGAADETTSLVSYTEMLNMVESGMIESVTIDQSTRTITAKALPAENDPTTRYYYTGYIEDPNLIPLLRTNNVTLSSEIPKQNSVIFDLFVGWLLPMLVFALFLSLLMRFVKKRLSAAGEGNLGGFGMNMGGSNAKVYVADETSVKFADVAGQDEAKESLMEIVDYLHNPSKYTSIGAKLPKGALLVGPPGTGKTLLAKAVAGEAGVPYFSISGSDFVEMFVGMGAKRVRELFKQADEKAPCIIFIDEIDAIGKSRDSAMSANDEREQTLNQLLSEMDGFDQSKAVVILAATNRPEVLDRALLRPGRFDRTINVTLPDKPGRLAILKVHTKNVRLSGDVDLEAVASMAAGSSGADLANLVNEAALRAVRFDRTSIAQEDFAEAFDTVVAGAQRKSAILSEKQKRIVAFHEIGHALVAARLTHTMPIQKITIIPRTSGALGFTMQAAEDDSYLKFKTDLTEELVTLLGGRAAEAVVFNEVSTGASNDIEKASALARRMVTMYGMSEEFGVMGLETVSSQYLDSRGVRECAEQTYAKVDEVVRTTLSECYERALAILRENADELHRAAEYLIKKETISGSEFMEIIDKEEQ